MNLRKSALSALIVGFVCGFLVPPAQAVILFGANPRNTTAPTGEFLDSGWFLQGAWQVGVGVPVAPDFFLTAAHLGGSPGDKIRYNGVDYTTMSFVDDPGGSDLRIWRVSVPFQTFAPLYRKTDELGRLAVAFGRGTQRGADVLGPNGAQGYMWGATDGLLSWGSNRVSFTTLLPDGPAGDFLAFDFSAVPDSGVPASATLTGGDSGGGLFLKDDDGLWKLAGIHFAVDGPWSLQAESGYFSAAMFDARDFYVGGPGDGNHLLVPHPTPDRAVPQSAYSTRVSSKLSFIDAAVNVPEPSAWLLFSVGLLTAYGARRIPKSSSRRETERSISSAVRR